MRSSARRRCRYTWLATGSFGRREPFPSSDVDCALAWERRRASRPSPRRPRPVRRGVGVDDRARGAGARRASRRAASRSTSTARSPRRPLFARSISGWADAARRWADDPDRDRGLVLLSVVVESDPVWGATRVPEALAAAFARAPGRERMLRRLAAAALAERPPTGFLRDFVLHSTGERKGVLDIKRGGLLPIESLARWGGLAAGVRAASTRARLGRGAGRGDARSRRHRYPARRVRADLRAADGASGRAAARGPPAGRSDRAEGADAAHALGAQGRVPGGRSRPARDRARARAQPALTTELIPTWRFSASRRCQR